MNKRNFIRHVQSTVVDLRLVEYEDVVQLVSNMNIYQDYWQIQQDMFEHQHDMVQRQYGLVQNEKLLKDFQ